MGNNLPPGVSVSDSDAPWNEPSVQDYLPLVCECGFKAETVKELEEHEHDKDMFSRP